MNIVYLGFDPREQVAFDVARASILKRTKTPIKIIPLRLDHLGGILTRPIERRDGRLWCPISNAPMSTEFAISRFCIPFIEDGWALFADCDIICWSDIDELFALADERYAVMCVKHNLSYTICDSKMDGQLQTRYQRKNWSSVVLWNCAHPANKRLTLANLNEWPGRDLHAFKWLDDYFEIGELFQQWNWLVNVSGGEPERNGIWHYTLGGPWFENWTPARYDDEWLVEAESAVRRSDRLTRALETCAFISPP